MTNRQVKICKIIRQYKRLDLILKKCDLADYCNLLDCFHPGDIDIEWGEQEKDENSIVLLSDNLLAKLEERERQTADNIFTRSIAIAALIISTLALLSEMGVFKLPLYSSSIRNRPVSGVEFKTTEIFSIPLLEAQWQSKSGLQYE